MSDFEQTYTWIRRRLGLIEIHAILGDANGVVYPDPVRQPGVMNVRYKTAADLSLPPALPMGPNFVGQDTPGTPVVCRYDNNGQLVIWGIDGPALRAQRGNPVLNNPAAAVNQKTTATETIVPLVSHPTSPTSLSVVVHSYFYIVNRVAKLFRASVDNGSGLPQGRIDLSSYVPTAGNQRLVGIFLKPDLSLEAAASTVQTLMEPLDLTDVQECVDGSSVGSTAVWFYWLHDGQTEILDSDKWLDGRQIINLNADGNEVRLATVAGVDMNTATPTTLYTGPGGASYVITRVVVRNASASLTTASWSYGFNNPNFDNVIANATHTELTTSALYTVLAAKAGAAVGTAGQAFKVLMNTLQGSAATTDMDVFGYLL
jgi:hypothetical protein